MYKTAVNKIQCIRKNSHYQCQIKKYPDCEASLSQSNDSSRVAIWKFILPKWNVKAKVYYQLLNQNSIHFEHPPAVHLDLDDATIKQCRHHPLNFKASLSHPKGEASC